METVRSGLAAIALTCGAVFSAHADDYSGSIKAQLNEESGPREVDWTFLTQDEIKQDWNICVLLPHLKDSYFVAANYGVADQIRRMGVSMTLYEAGGYTNLSTQLSQLDNCIAQGADGIILAAISADGVGALVRKATSAGIPVIDFVTGVNDPSTSGHALVSYYTMAQVIGEYLVGQVGDTPTKVGYFPGPQGAGWSDSAVQGFQDAIEGSPIEIEVLRRADTGLNIQMDLISNALLTYPELEWIVGVGIAAEGGAVAVRNAGLAGQVKVAAFNTSPQVNDYIKSGQVVAAPTDFPPLQGRLAVDMVLRYLEEKDVPGKRVGPKPELLTADTVDDFPFTDMYSPADFEVVFTVTSGK